MVGLMLKYRKINIKIDQEINGAVFSDWDVSA